MYDIERIKNNFNHSIKIKTAVVETLAAPIAAAAKILVQCFSNKHKILCCGNGGSACDALHFAAEMLNRFEQERPGLPAIALPADTATITAIANDYCYDDIFAKQITALGQTQDVLLAITTSGNSNNLIRAVKAAHDNEMHVIALTGNEGGKIAAILNKNDIELRVTNNSTARIQEVHLLIIHCLCDLIDSHLFPQNKK